MCVHIILLDIVPPYDDIAAFLAITGIEDTFNGPSFSLSGQD